MSDGFWKSLLGSDRPRTGAPASTSNTSVAVLKQGPAMRVVFFYPGEEGTYIDNAYVTLYENGIVYIRSSHEETATHLQNCEILWNFETDADDRSTKVRLLKPKSDSRGADSPVNPDKNP